jgi:lipid II:glycine glycyltransferase (peptidoglycan interpeptide bridge formation enzyme)
MSKISIPKKDIRHCEEFQNFMKELGWISDEIDGELIYLRKFPLLGYFAKMPRPGKAPSISKILSYCKSHHIFQFKMSPSLITGTQEYFHYKKQLLDNQFRIDRFPFNPTTTIYFDLKKSEEDLFNSFSSAKRRGIRRAKKNGITIIRSSNLKPFEWMRWRQFGWTGFLISHEMKHLWKFFYPKKGTLLLAYQTGTPSDPDVPHANSNIPVAGVFMIHHKNLAVYWYASAWKIGKRLQAPSLLIWESLKLAKEKGCTIFDCDGIADPRFPEASKPWLGFTKFKEGFNGETVEFCENFTINL